MSQAPFSNLSEFRACLDAMPALDADARRAAEDHNAQLTKPPGALGRLEDLAIWYAGWRGTATPQVDNAQVVVFAGNHGIAAQGVSAFPAEVTAQMVMNFEHGGAAINQICKSVGAALNVVALELETPTDDFTQGPAMTEDAFVKALQTGWTSIAEGTDLLVVGEMGIANTTAGAAVAYAILGGSPEDWVGRGTGVTDAGVVLKARVVAQGLTANPGAEQDGLVALRCLGGRELAAMAGAIAAARSRKIPVILDGFICSAAALALHKAKPGVLDHCVAGHLSQEAAHGKILNDLEKKPILTLDLRLGEASGGAMAIAILKGAIACHSGMATFAQAGVSEA